MEQSGGGGRGEALLGSIHPRPVTAVDHTDGSSHTPHKDVSYSSHNAVTVVLEPVGGLGDDGPLPISSQRSDALTGFLSVCPQHQCVTP